MAGGSSSDSLMTQSISSTLMPTSRLSDVTNPGKFRCVSVECVGDAMVRLKRLGICGERTVEVIQPGDPMVLKVVGSRLGVSRRLAESVIVSPICETSMSGQADAVKNA